MTEPTSVGEIIAYFKANLDDFDRGADSVQAEADRLDGKTINIRFTTSAADAIAQIKALDVATDASSARIAAAQRRVADATSRVSLAEGQLYVARLKAGGVPTAEQATQIAKAEAQLEAAVRSQATAFDRLALATRTAGDRAQETHKSISTLGTAIAAIGPAAVPLGAVLAAGFGAGAGAAGSLLVGIRAIQADLKSGTGVGIAYAAGLATVRTDLHDLGEVAASNLLGPFNREVGDLTQRMPVLRGEVGQFSATAGDALAHFTAGAVGGFQTLEPVMATLLGDVDDLARRFDAYANGGGLVKFADYARQNLPAVEQDVASIAAAIGHLVAAFAPLGVNSLGTLRLVSDLINAIPIEVLRVAAPLATGFYLAIQGGRVLDSTLPKLQALADRVIALGVAEQASAVKIDANTGALTENAIASERAGAASLTATGRVGLFGTGLAALARGPAAVTLGLGALAVGVDQLTAKLAGSQPILTGPGSFFGDLLSGDLAGALSAVGTNIGDLFHGNAPTPLGQVISSVNAAGDKQAAAAAAAAAQQAQAAVDAFNASVKSEADQLGITTQQASTYAAMVGVTQDQVKAGTTDQLGYNMAVAAVARVYDSASTAGSTFLDALQTFSTSAGSAADRAKLLGAYLVASQGDALGYAGAVASAYQANASLTQSFADQAKQVKAGQLSFSATEKAAIDLKTGMINLSAAGAGPLIQQLQAMQTAAAGAAEATYQHEIATKGAAKAGADAATVFQTQTYTALVNDAAQLGITKDQAQKLATQYFNMPKDVSTQASLIGSQPVIDVLNKIGGQLAFLTGHPWNPKVGVADSATGKLLSIQHQLEGLNGQRSTVEVDYFQKTIVVGGAYSKAGAPGGPIAQADGGAVIGAGGPKTDSIPRWLSNGEHVLTADDVTAMGGQSGVYAFRKSLHSPSMAKFPVAAPVSSAAPGLRVGLGGDAERLVAIEHAVRDLADRVDQAVGRQTGALAQHAQAVAAGTTSRALTATAWDVYYERGRTG